MTLGQKLRARRLLWQVAPQHGCLVRIGRDHGGPGRHRIECWPVDVLVPKDGAKREWCLLDPKEADAILDATALAPIRRVKRGFAVTCDDEGRIVT